MSTTNSVFPCAICLETACEPVATRCGHLFCWGCLDQWLNSGRSTCDCPVCKGRVDPKIAGDIIPLYGVGRSEGATESPSSAAGGGNAEYTGTASSPPPQTPSNASEPGSHTGTGNESQSGQRHQEHQRQHAFHRRPAPQDVPGPRRQNPRLFSLGTSGFASSFLFLGSDLYTFALFGILFLLYQYGLPWMLQEVYPCLRRRWRSWRNGRGAAPTSEAEHQRERGPEGRSDATTAEYSIPPIFMRYVHCALAVAMVSFVISVLVM